MASGAVKIANERLRQINQEGWTAEHDDEHDDGMLTRAAICYADKAAVQARGVRDSGQMRPIWPFEPRWYKPSEDPVENLVKAGALIAAEIDRIQRTRTEQPSGSGELGLGSAEWR